MSNEKGIVVNRIMSVDLIRLLAITAVIVIHTTPFSAREGSGDLYYYLYILCNQITRFAVPFFFVTSGFFWGGKIRNGANITIITRKMVSRISVIFLSWSVIYLIPFNMIEVFESGQNGLIGIVKDNFMTILQNPSAALLHGTKVHLWFLVSLIISSIICSLFIKHNAIRLLALVAIVLYVAGVLMKSYAETPIGLTTTFDSRNGPFMGVIFFYIGYLISGYTPQTKWLYYGLLLFSVGTAMHFLEIYALMKLFNILVMQDYVFGTLLMGVGISVISLSNHQILYNRFLSKLGAMTLGIYACHYIYVDLLKPIDDIVSSAIWEIGYVILVLILSILTTYLLSKLPYTKRLVS